MQPLQHLKKLLSFWFDEGASGAGLIQTVNLPFAGELFNIHQVNGSNTGTVTAKLELVDGFGITIFDGTAKAHNAAYDHEFGLSTRRVLDGNDTMRCTISGDPGSGGYRVSAVVSFFGRLG